MLLIAELVEEADESNDIHVDDNDDRSTEKDECQAREVEFMSIFLWPINSLFQKYILRILMLYIIKLRKESKTEYCPSIHFLA